MDQTAASKERNYPTDVSDEEWEFCAPYLTLMREDAPQREHSLRDVFNALRWMIKAGCPWRLMPTNMPPWKIVHEQAQRWIRAGVFEAMVHDLRVILRVVMEQRKGKPTAAISIMIPFPGGGSWRSCPSQSPEYFWSGKNADQRPVGQKQTCRQKVSPTEVSTTKWMK